jgi:hypothetical protein
VSEQPQNPAGESQEPVDEEVGSHDEAALPPEPVTEVAPPAPGTQPEAPAPTAAPPPAALQPPPPPPPPPPPTPHGAGDGGAPAADRPEVPIGAAFAGGFVLAMILKRLAR